MKYRKKALVLKNNGGVFSVLEFKPSVEVSAAEAVMNGVSLNIPYLKFLPNQHDPRYVSELFDVWMNYDFASNTLTITAFSGAR